ncbi:FKBP-type peptidyl-prolyl cis-trans isomerase [Aliikangiella coralliicola]|uniref:Peptidyl-prolyl cis-trans isomerase n=1 Tax=Aliikangiella coralliicola TaxID=2592383 RepID=A0A545U096_9GAMM|nr:peptidylprolyl isomerase [Aliikangiella coralliicola]TQV82888.1 peptidylprolyl isomerase [Aliikangiella coralliicola]
MKIENDKVVQFNYKLSDANDKVLEESGEKVPMAYLHGHKNLLPALEREMEGKQAGDQFSAILEPSEAYGEIRPDQEQRIPVKHLQGAKKWKKGMVGVVQTEKGRRQVTVVKVGKFMVTVDFNHPFAGKTLKFDVEIVDVRDATNEEIAHGHAHGVGGHHH